MELEVSQDLKERRTNDLPSSPHPRMKNVEKKDSISSVDSDLSLSFDRRGSKSDEADLSDYDSEIRFVKERDRDQDSGADSVDDAASKEVIQVERQVDVPSDAPTDAARATVEKTTTAFVRPTDELADKICAQVEYYFSDENIIKDAFLLKHVKRNKEGYVSLKLISSFKKVKHLSRDWRAVGAALTRSKKLEINSQGTKLRRVTPLPPFDQTAPSRTILAAGLPIENVTVDAVAEIFKPCGEIALIRVLKPGRPIPPEVRQAIAKRPDVASIEECAMVEFTDSASTRRAMQMALGDAKVFELRHLVDKKRKHQPAKKCSLTRVAREDTHTNSSSCPSGSEPEDGRVRLQRGFQGYPRCHVHNTSYPFQGPPSPDTCLSRKLSSCSISSSENGFVFRRLSSCSGSGSSSDSGRRYSTCSSGSEAAFFHPSYSNTFYHHENRRYSCCSATGSPMECRGSCYIANRRGSADYGPLSRRLSTYSRDYDTNIGRGSLCSSNSEHNVFHRARSTNNIAIMHVPENVMRMPSGPDGTRGFFGRFVRRTSVEPIH
ncbi:la ribonucleoprotein translational regulator Achilles isoform X2 [Temnothorax americanus]|uniref:la ribonucleoprotein translational regulator Achilles isoform X2 n=1 Tax=Temnothorax americanus TaxID=1964332 RepID=UPI004068ECAC